MLTLDFTDAEVLRAARIRSGRQTRTSRKPGKKVRGTVHREAEERHLMKCECGNYRWNDDVPHAVRIGADVSTRVDCVGRIVRTGEPITTKEK